MAKQESFNTYCYDMVVSKICNGVEKTLLSSKECAGAITINNWSPNNVRRLIISPSGFIVQFYVTARNNKILDIGLFNNIQKLNLCFASDDYKPMLRALTDVRVCSCIEEIVYLTAPNNRGMYLPLEEIRVDKFNIGFKRLHSRVFLEMTLEDFYKKFKADLVKPDFQLCEADLNDIPNAKVQLLAKDWWKSYPLRPVYYSLDAEGSRLEKYFSKTEADISKGLEAKKVSDVKKKLLGEHIDNLVKADAKLTCVMKGAFRLAKLLESQENTLPLVDDEKRSDSTLIRSIQSCLRGNKLTLGDLKEISKLNKDFLYRCSILPTTVENFDGSEAELYKTTKNTINLIAGSAYAILCNYMLDCMQVVGTRTPITLKFQLRGIERYIAIPNSLEEKARLVEERCDLHFDGKDFKHSVCNCFVVLSALLIKDGREKYNKDYWLKVTGGDK